MLRAIIAAGLLWPASAVAQKSEEYPHWPWVSAGAYAPPGQRHLSMWLNMETIRRVDQGVIEAWIRFKSDRPDENGAMDSTLYERLDCKRNWHSSILLVKRNRRGGVVYEKRGKPEEMEPIEPDTLLAGMMPFICAAGGMPQ